MTGHATELANLDKTRQAHIAALNAGDALRWAACFASDAVQMPPNDPPNAGAESIRAWSGAFLAAFAVKFCQEKGAAQLADMNSPGRHRSPGWTRRYPAGRSGEKIVAVTRRDWKAHHAVGVLYRSSPGQPSY